MTDLSFIPNAVDLAPTSIAGGEGSGTDIFGAAVDNQVLTNNTVSAFAAHEQAYDNRIQAVKAVTGETLDNPLSALTPFLEGAPALPVLGPALRPLAEQAITTQAAAQLGFQQKLEELAANADPDTRDIIGADRPITADAQQLAQQSDATLANLMASHPNWDKFAWSFLGQGAGSIRDPVTIGSLFAGGGPADIELLGSKILGSAAREAVVNAGVTALAQPSVQAWRQQAGLGGGFADGLENVLAAGAFGGVLGAGGGVIGKLFKHAAGAPDVPPELDAAVGGDGAAAASVMAPIRDALQPEARGAMDATTDLGALLPEAPADAAAASRRQLLADQAQAAAQLRQAPAVTLPDDEGQIARVADRLAPAPESLADYQPPAVNRDAQDTLIAEARGGAPATPAPASRPIAQFVKSIGGIDPESPIADELRARGLTSRTAPGLFVRGGRDGLDNIPLDELPPELTSRLGDDGNGYADPQGFIDGLEGELGTKAGAGAPEDLRGQLERQGVDLSAPDEAIRARLAERADADARFAARDSEIAGAPLDGVFPGIDHGAPSMGRREAIGFYRGLGYAQINKWAREGRFPQHVQGADRVRASATVRGLLEAARPLEEDIRVFRGRSDADSEKGFRSFTEDREIAEQHASKTADGRVDEIVLPKGTPVVHVGGGEHELIVPPSELVRNLTQETRNGVAGTSSRAMAENAVRQAQRALGGTFSDDVVHRVADLVLHEHEPVGDAVDFVLGREAGMPREAGEPGPIDALGPEPPPLLEEPAGPNAGEAAEHDLFKPQLEALPKGDVIPSDEGLGTPEAINEEIEHSGWLERVVAACKA